MIASPYESGNNRLKFTRGALMVLAIAALLAIQYHRGHWPFQSKFETPAPVIDNNTEPPIEDDKQEQQLPDKSDLEGSYLVVVEESKNRTVERIKVLNDYGFWFTLRDRGLKGFRVLDPDSAESSSFVAEARKRAIAQPFVMHVSATGKVLHVIPFPRQISEIEAMLK